MQINAMNLYASGSILRRYMKIHGVRQIGKVKGTYHPAPVSPRPCKKIKLQK